VFERQLHPEVAAFVLASHDYEQAAGKCFDGLQGGVYVGGLGIVEKADAGDFRDEFEPVFDTGEASHGRGNGGRFGAGQKSRAGRRENIFEIVLAAQGGREREVERRLFARVNDMLIDPDVRARRRLRLRAFQQRECIRPPSGR